ncbi:hypothetical protein [Hafnia alvei]|uniref:hypothetical protein n=1 Tax=Hafnia alvei TaxID=569 RepID=UPI00345E09D8
MAKVTSIFSISNNTPYTITVRNGENLNQIFSIPAGGAYDKAVWVPWIGNSEENWKAICLLLGPQSQDYIWLFQDYWNPSGANAVKYLIAPQMDYDAETSEVDGNNRGGGNKALVINHKNDKYILKMI